MDNTLIIYLLVVFLSGGVGFISGIAWEKACQATKTAREIYESVKKYGK